MSERIKKASQSKLTIENLNEVLNYLKKNRNINWRILGLELGLYNRTLNDIESDNSGAEDCLSQCISKWFQGADDVDKYGGANWISLYNAIEKIDPAVADDNSSSEGTQLRHSQGGPSPTSTSSRTGETYNLPSPDPPSSVSNPSSTADAKRCTKVLKLVVGLGLGFLVLCIGNIIPLIFYIYMIVGFIVITRRRGHNLHLQGFFLPFYFCLILWLLVICFVSVFYVYEWLLH